MWRHKARELRNVETKGKKSLRMWRHKARELE
jgi:hypothetical protein